MQLMIKHKRLLLSLMLILTLVFTGTISSVTAAGTSYERVADPDTSDTYIDKMVTQENGSKNAGRLWTDKSVYTEGVSLDTDTDGVEATIDTDADFLHAYSLLSSSQLINEEIPLDVMFVIDISFSMHDDNAILRTTKALNNSVNQLLEDNPSARFGLALFSTKAAVVLPLGFYKPVPGQSFSNVSIGAKGFVLTFNYHDVEEDQDKVLRVDNDDTTSLALKEESWHNVLTNVNGKDFIIGGDSTNIQAGLKAGLEQLANAEDTVITSSLGRKISRIPAMILLTDGSANTMGNITNIIPEEPVPDGETFIDSDGNKGRANFDFTSFDITQDFAHSGNYFELYGFNRELNPNLDNTVGSTANFVRDGKISTMPGVDQTTMTDMDVHDPIVLSTLLTASYYTAAINDHYQTLASQQSVSNLNEVKLQNYTIFNETSTIIDGSDVNMDTVNKIMNPKKYFTQSEQEGDAYDLYSQWILENKNDVSQLYYTRYDIVDAFYGALAEFFNGSPEWNEYLDIMSKYDPEKDGDLKAYDDEAYMEGINKVSKRLYGMPYAIRTELTLDLNDEDYYNRNPYGITKEDLKDNLYYLPSRNSLTIGSSEIENTFSNIIDELTGKAFLAVSGYNSLGVEDSITYMDPIGKYMEIKDDVKVDGEQASMALVLNGNIDPLVKTAVYDYQFNNSYVASHDDGSFIEGWYYGDDPEEAYRSDDGSWEKGFVYRVRYSTAISFVPTLQELKDTNNDNEITAEDLTEKQKNTVYTFYRFDLDNDKDGTVRRSWRVNPSYLDSIDDLSVIDIDPNTYVIRDSKKQEYFDNLEAQGKTIPDGVYRLSDIRVWNEDTGDYLDSNQGQDMIANLGYDQALYVNIPASAVPTQVVELSYNEEEGKINYKANTRKKAESTPMRLYYSLGIEDDIKVITGDGVELTKVDKTYLDTHSNDQGQIFFLSNYYSNTTYDDYISEGRSRTRGDPVITFSPRIDNKYYVFQNYHILYDRLYQVQYGQITEVTDQVPLSFDNDLYYEPFDSKEAAEIALRSGELNEGDFILIDTDASTALSDTQAYFMILNYYKEDPDNPGTAQKAMAVTRRSGAVFSLDIFEDIKEDNILCWYDPDNLDTPVVDFKEPRPEGYVMACEPGGIRLGDMAQTIETKGDSTGGAFSTENLTLTANNYFLPTISLGSGTGDDVLFNMYLGNNGILRVDNTELFVTKLVSDKDGEYATSNTPLAYKEFDYQIYLQGFSGVRSAIKVQWDDEFKLWRRRIASIDVLTNNDHYLQYSDYSLVRANAEGEVADISDKNNVTDYPYYIYVNNQSTDDQSGQQVIRVYNAPDNTSGEMPSGLRTRDDKAIYFKANSVYLVPHEVVESGTPFTPDYQEIKEFTIATMYPEQMNYRTNGVDLTSPYLIRSEYLTVSLDFGIKNQNDGSALEGGTSLLSTNTEESADRAEGQNSDNTQQAYFKAPTYLFDNNSFTITGTNNRIKMILSNTMVDHTAQFKLKHGEGLLFTGISSGSDYRITEKLDPVDDKGWSLWNQWEKGRTLTREEATPELKVAVKHLKQDSFVAYDEEGNIIGAYDHDRDDVLSDNELKDLKDTFTTAEIKDQNDPDNSYNVYSVFGETSILEEGVQFTNTSNTDDVVISKELRVEPAGEGDPENPEEVLYNTQLNDIDLNKDFDFKITIIPPKEMVDDLTDSVCYPFKIFSQDNASDDQVIDQGYLMTTEDTIQDKTGTLNYYDEDQIWTVSLKADQYIVIYDLLVGTDVDIKEVPVEGYYEASFEEKESDSDTEDDQNETAETISDEDPETDTTEETYEVKEHIVEVSDPEIEGKSNEFKFINYKRSPEPVSVELFGQKTIETKVPTDPDILENVKKGPYSFGIVPDDNNPDGDPLAKASKVVLSDENGKITFFDQTTQYTKAGTYFYTISELEDGIPNGVSRDETSYKVVVTIKEDYGPDKQAPEYQGKLTASINTYKNNDQMDQTVPDLLNSADFNNIYEPHPTQITIQGEKSFKYTKDSSDILIDMKGGEFDFKLESVYWESEEDPLPTPVETVNNADGTFEFDPVVFNEPGQYVFRVSEVVEVPKSFIVYDTSEFYVLVHVKDKNGQLEANIDDLRQTSVSDPAVLENISEELPGETVRDLIFINTCKTGDLTVEKEVSGNLADKSDKFKFEVELSDKDLNGTFGSEDTAMKFVDGVAQFELSAGQHKTATDLPAGMTYTVTETDPKDYTTTVTSDNERGNIVENENTVVTVNNRKTGPVSTTIEGIKTLNNYDQEDITSSLKTGEFSFILKASPDNSETDPVNGEIIATNDGQGNFEFDLNYSQEGIYKYTLTELAEEGNDYIYDTNSYNIVIKVNKDENGDLQIEKTITSTIPKTDYDLLGFTNTRLPDPTSIVLGGEKEFVNGNLAGNDFIFSIEAQDGAPLPETTLTYNDLNGNFSFDTIVYDKEGTYTYLIREIDPQDPMIESSKDVFKAVVTVTSTGGKLIAEVDYTKIEGDIEEIVDSAHFTNIQRTGSLEVEKQVIGTEKDRNQSYNFKVSLYKDPELTDLATRVLGNYGDMTFSHGVAEFKLRDSESVSAEGLPAGLYYNVEEFDNEGFTAEFTNQMGVIENDSSVLVDCTNIREQVIPVNYAVEIQKVVAGEPAQERLFNFLLELREGDPEGVILPDDVITTVEGSGITRFGNITFTKAGTYSFAVREINIPENYTVDQEEHLITIVVEETDRELQIASVENDDQSDRLVFVNTYEDPEKSVAFVGIAKFHAKQGQSYHVAQNEVRNEEKVWYNLRIKNKGNGVAHNLVIYDSIPQSLGLMNSFYISRELNSVTTDRKAYDLMSSYDSRTGLLLISQLDDQGIDLAPGEVINIEYEVKIPIDLPEEEYWTNHAWFTYDEIGEEEVVQHINTLQTLMASDASEKYSLDDFENLMNYDKIDTPIELDKVSGADDHHSLYEDDYESVMQGRSRSVGGEDEPVHVKYSNDVREHFVLESVTTPETPDDPTDKTDPEKTPSSQTKQKQQEDLTDTSQETGTGSSKKTQSSSTATTNTGSNNTATSTSSSISSGSTTTTTTTTGTTNSPKTGLDSSKRGTYITITVVCVLILIGLFIYGQKEKKKTK